MFRFTHVTRSTDPILAAIRRHPGVSLDELSGHVGLDSAPLIGDLIVMIERDDPIMVEADFPMLVKECLEFLDSASPEFGLLPDAERAQQKILGQKVQLALLDDNIKPHYSDILRSLLKRLGQ